MEVKAPSFLVTRFSATCTAFTSTCQGIAWKMRSVEIQLPAQCADLKCKPPEGSAPQRQTRLLRSGWYKQVLTCTQMHNMLPACLMHHTTATQPGGPPAQTVPTWHRMSWGSAPCWPAHSLHNLKHACEAQREQPCAVAYTIDHTLAGDTLCHPHAAIGVVLIAPWHWPVLLTACHMQH